MSSKSWVMNIKILLLICTLAFVKGFIIVSNPECFEYLRIRWDPIGSDSLRLVLMNTENLIVNILDYAPNVVSTAAFYPWNRVESGSYIIRLQGFTHAGVLDHEETSPVILLPNCDHLP